MTPPLGAAFVADPHPLFRQLRRDAPVWQVGDTPLFLVTTWHLVNEAAARVDDFSNHFRHTLFLHDDGTLGVLDNGDAGATDVFAGADPPDHGAHRAIFFPELVQKRLAHLEPEVVARTDALLDGTLVSSGYDVAASLANPLPLQVMAERVIGFSDPDPADLQRWVLDGSRLVSGRLRLDEMAGAADAVAGLWPWVDGQLEAALSRPAAAGPGPGVLDAAADGVRRGVLTRAQASFTLMILLGAGGETTTSLIGNAIRILAERPALQAQVREHPELVPIVLEETLRYESPFRFHPRLARGAGHQQPSIVELGHQISLAGRPVPQHPQRPVHRQPPQHLRLVREAPVGVARGVLTHVLQNHRRAVPLAACQRDERVAVVAQGRLADETELRHEPRAEGLDDDVGAGAQLPREREIPRVLEVQDERALVAVEAEEVARALLGERRAPGPRVVARARPLDLDDVRAEVAEGHRAQRPGEHAREVSDEQAVQGAGGHGRQPNADTVRPPAGGPAFDGHVAVSGTP